MAKSTAQVCDKQQNQYLFLIQCIFPFSPISTSMHVSVSHFIRVHRIFRYAYISPLALLAIRTGLDGIANSYVCCETNV